MLCCSIVGMNISGNAILTISWNCQMSNSYCRYRNASVTLRLRVSNIFNTQDGFCIIAPQLL